MTTRRRRVGSETEQDPLVVVSGDYRPYQRQEISQNISNGPPPSDYNVEDRGVKEKDNILNPTMTSRDRTTEFSNAVRSFQSRQMTRAFVLKNSKKSSIQSYSEFMMIAKTIGKNISNTYIKLEKLTLLAKRISLFNDRPTEIQELTYIIKEDLHSLNQQIARLQEVARKQRHPQPNGHLSSHSSNVVLTLQSKLASMSTEFKQVLEVRTENLKQQKVRRDQFSTGGVSSSLPQSAMTGFHQGSVLLQDQQALAIDMDEQSPLLPPMQRQATMSYDDTENYLQSRAETMQNIESTIVELGGIFQQLAHMVKEQEEMVERIDTNVEDAELNVEAAHGEILKYFQSVSSNRWLMIKIFAVLILFFLFFVIFM